MHRVMSPALGLWSPELFLHQIPPQKIDTDVRTHPGIGIRAAAVEGAIVSRSIVSALLEMTNDISLSFT